MLEITAQILNFFKKNLLFSHLSEEQIVEVARQFEIVEKEADEYLYSNGDPANYFYILWQGEVHILLVEEKIERPWSTVILGDFFGEELLDKEYREDNAKVVKKSRIFRIHREKLTSLLQNFPRVNELLNATARSRIFAREKKFKWLSSDEIVYYIQRKHVYFLLVKLIIPFLLVLLFAGILGGAFISANDLMRWVGIVGLLISLFTVIWVWVDWGNDYTVVTSRKVLSVEKIALLYDNRMEAPLDTILSTNVVSNQFLRMFIDYGTVIVKTFTGSIRMPNIKSPNILVLYINGLKLRAGELARQFEAEIMRELVRKRLRPAENEEQDGNLEEDKAEVETETQEEPEEDEKVSKTKKKTGFMLNFLKVRYVEGDTIIYRKHWFVLLKKIWWQLLLIGLSLFAGCYLFKISGSNVLILGFLVLVLTILFGIMIYRFVDWKNDIYLVTLDHILDIERKPLGSENKKSATLDNILSLENKRVGIFGILLNFGTVIINIGTEQFNFHDVYNPAQVQYEIFDRMLSLRHRKEQMEASKERERIADWLMIYHNEVETLEDLENNKNQKKDSE